MINFTADQATTLFVVGLVLFVFLLVPAVRALFRLLDTAEQTIETLMTKHGQCEIYIGDQVQYVGKDAMLHGFYTVNTIDEGAGIVRAHFTGYSAKQMHLPTTVKELLIRDIRVHRNGCLHTPVRGEA